ncbi:MAG: methyl-accepting chemotaxis protein [Mangrovicoccus sp.]
MSFFNNIRMGIKLPVAMVLMMLVAMSVTTILGFLDASKFLKEDADERLQIALEIQRDALHAWIDHHTTDLAKDASSDLVFNAIVGFKSTFKQIEGDPKKYLAKSYDAATKSLVDSNSGFSIVYDKFAPQFDAMAAEHGYSDVYLIGSDGTILYSAEKRGDWGTNVLSGAESGLGKAFARVLSQNEPVMVDYSTYAPADNIPSGFVAVPVYSSSRKVLGVLAARFDLKNLENSVISRKVLGSDLELLLFGADGTLRNEGRILNDAKPMEALALDVSLSEIADPEIQLTDLKLSSGEMLRTSHIQLDLAGTSWILMVAQASSTIVQPAKFVLTQQVTHSAIFAVLLLGACFLLARSVAKPLFGLAKNIRAVSEGNLSSDVKNTKRGDEIGDIAKAIEGLKSDLSAADETEKDAHLKGAALASTSAALMMTDKNFCITYMNDAVQKILDENAEFFRTVVPNFDPSNLIGANMDSFHKNAKHIRALVEKPELLPYNADIAIGDMRFSLMISAVNDVDGNHIGQVVEWKEVTKERLNGAILDAINTHQCTAQFYPNGSLEQCNSSFVNALGRVESDLVGKKQTDIFSFNPTLAKENGPVWERLVKGQSVYGKFKLSHGAGGDVWLEGGFSPVMDQRNEAIRIVFMGSDRTEEEASLQISEAERVEMERLQTEAIEGLRQALTAMAAGDLTAQIHEEFASEYEQLRNDFNQSVSHLLTAMQGVAENANSIRGEAGDISQAADDLSRRTEKQAATLEETAAALDQLTSSVKSAAEGALRADEVVNTAKSNAEASGKVVREAVEAMGEIEKSSEQISKIISVIDDIAFQTNLLALNAGVEAARAGEAGRGFAVVASEVRALAQRSSDAAREINDLISASSSQVKRGVDLVGQTGDALKDIVGSVSNISSHVSEIALSANEQSSGLAEINVAVNQLDQVTQQNAAMFEQTTAASHNLTREAEALSSTISNFELANGAVALRQGSSNQPASAVNMKNTESFVKERVISSSQGNAALKSEVDTDLDGWEDF